MGVDILSVGKVHNIDIGILGGGFHPFPPKLQGGFWFK